MSITDIPLADETHLLLQWVKNHGNEPPIVVFVKHFDVSHQTLAGLGHFYVHRHMRVMDLALMINEKMKYPATTPLKIYEVGTGSHESSEAIADQDSHDLTGDQAKHD